MAGPSTFVISLTPFAADESLDEDALRAHLRRMVAAGVGVYLGGSGSGEGYTLSTDEARRVLEIGVEELAGRVPVRAMGVEPRTAAEMVALGRLAAEAGVEAMQVYSLDQGHGNSPRPAELERYLDDVLGAVTLPCVVSTHQAVGYWYPPELVGRVVARHGHVIGVNVTSPDITYLARVIDAVEGRAEVHVGGPMHALTCLALGGQGFLSSDANLDPVLCRTVVHRWAGGDLTGAAGAYRDLMALFGRTRALGGIVATKAVLGRLGLPGGSPRRPRLPFDPARTDELDAIIDELGLDRLRTDPDR